MKNTLAHGIMWYCCMFLSLQSIAQCELPDAFVQSYAEDVQALAVEQMLLAGSPDANSIGRIQSYEDEIWKAMSAVYFSSTPEADSVLNIFCLHHLATDYVKRWLYVEVDTTFPWTQSWLSEQNHSGNAMIDSVLEDYPYDAEVPFLSLDVVRLKFHDILNLQAIAEFLETVPGVNFSERVPYNGDGDNMQFFKGPDTWTLAFEAGWGDCLSGCTGQRLWTFEITPEECEVQYTYSYGVNPNVDIPGIGQLYPENCNLTTSFDHDVKPSGLIISPNPADTYVSVSSEKEISCYALHDVTGNVIHAGRHAGKFFDCNVESLVPGIYVMHLVFADGSGTMQKIVRQSRY